MRETMMAAEDPTPNGPWNPETTHELRGLDPQFAAVCTKMSTNPWTSGVLPRKFVELVGVGLNAA
jgi:hypothetical protein